jgi:hypothetical protein
MMVTQEMGPDEIRSQLGYISGKLLDIDEKIDKVFDPEDGVYPRLSKLESQTGTFSRIIWLVVTGFLVGLGTLLASGIS